MPNNILVIDNDPSLAYVLQRPLALKGYSVQVTEGGEAALQKIAQSEPSLMFLAVDLPDRKGFELFTKAKRITPRVPVVMVTSTLPQTDLQLHEKLRIHADYYFDKRTLTADALANALNSLLGLDLEPEGLSTISAAKNVPSNLEPSDGSPEVVQDDVGSMALSDRANGGQDESLLEELYPEGLEPDMLSTLEDETLGDDESLEEGFPVGGTDGNEDTDELREQIAELRAELGDARRDAQSSPFSTNFSTLRDSTRKKDKNIRILKRKVVSLTRDVLAFNKERDELAGHLKQSSLEKSHLVSKLEDLDKRWDFTENKLSTLQKEHDEAKARHAAEREELSQEIATKNAELRSSEKRHQSDRNELLTRHSHELEKKEREHSSQLTALEKKLKGEKERLNELLSRHSLELEKAEKEHSSQLTALEKKLKGEKERLNELLSRHSLELEKIEKENSFKLTVLEKKLKDENEKAISSLKTDFATRQKDKHQQYVQSLEGLKEQNQTEIIKLKRFHQESLAKAKRELEELRKKIADKEAELVRQRTHFQEQLNEAEERHRSDLAAETKQWRSKLEGFEKEEHSIRQGLEGRLGSVKQEARSQLAALEQEKRGLGERFDKKLSDAEDQMRSKLAAVQQEKQELRKQLEARLTTVENDWRAKHQKLEQEKRQAEEHLEDKLEKARVMWRNEQTRLEAEKQDLLRKNEEESKEIEGNWNHQLSRLETEKQVIEQSLENRLKETEEKYRLDLERADKQRVSEREDLENKYNAELQKLRENIEKKDQSAEELQQKHLGELRDTEKELARVKTSIEVAGKDYEAKINDLHAKHEHALKQAEMESRSMISALETQAIEGKEQTVNELEAGFRQKLEKERQEHSDVLTALHKKFDEEIKIYQNARQASTSVAAQAAVTHAASEIKTLKDRLTQLKGELANKDTIVAQLLRAADEQKRSLTEKNEEIDSLKAVIKDSYR